VKGAAQTEAWLRLPWHAAVLVYSNGLRQQRPVTRSVRFSSRPPAADTTPSPSADTTMFGLREYYSRKVP